MSGLHHIFLFAHTYPKDDILFRSLDIANTLSLGQILIGLRGHYPTGGVLPPKPRPNLTGICTWK